MNQNNNQYPQYPQTPPPVPSQGMSAAALVCGIIGIVGIFIPKVVFVAWIFSILGIVFGAMGRKRAPIGRTGLATAGLVLGIIALSLDVLAIICVIAAIGAIGSIFGSISV